MESDNKITQINKQPNKYYISKQTTKHHKQITCTVVENIRNINCQSLNKTTILLCCSPKQIFHQLLGRSNYFHGTLSYSEKQYYNLFRLNKVNQRI